MNTSVPLDLYIDYTTQTTCTVAVDENIIFSGIWEITYKPNDPALEPIETKITGEFNDIDFYRRIFNLQPEMNYLVHVKIYTDDDIYVSDELEFRTLAFHAPLVNMYININKDILFSLSTDPADDPLPSDASYYIAYFLTSDPSKGGLKFHRVNGNFYVLPIVGHEELEVLAFIRYGYEIDDNDLIEDVQASFGGVITLDNGFFFS
jgi:hypothetical protein